MHRRNFSGTSTKVKEQTLPMFVCHLLSFSNDSKLFVNSNASSPSYQRVYTHSFLKIKPNFVGTGTAYKGRCMC